MARRIIGDQDYIDLETMRSGTQHPITPVLAILVEVRYHGIISVDSSVFWVHGIVKDHLANLLVCVIRRAAGMTQPLFNRLRRAVTIG